MDLEKLKGRLKKYHKEDIIITDNAELQALTRGVDLDEVKENIINPDRLVYARPQKAQKKNEEKYDCYFACSKHLYHRYALILNGKVLIVTIIKIKVALYICK